MPRCESCPMARGDVACVGESSPIFCAWAASGDPARRRHVVLRSAAGPLPEVRDPSPAPGPDATPPGLLARATSLTRAVAGFVASGMATADDATLARRIAACESCEVFDAPRRTCNACGCFCDVKARLSSQSCPRGKW